MGACFYQSAISIQNMESKVGAPLIIASSLLYLLSVLIGIAHFSRHCDSCKTTTVESPQQLNNRAQTGVFEMFGRFYNQQDDESIKTDLHGFIITQAGLLWSVKISSFICLCALVIFSVSFGSVHHLPSAVTNNTANYLFAFSAPLVIVLVLLWVKSGLKSLQTIIPPLIILAQAGCFQIINLTRY
jgi:hypothetical protein